MLFDLGPGFSTGSDRVNTPEDTPVLLREPGSTRAFLCTLCGLRMGQPPTSPPLNEGLKRCSTKARVTSASVASSMARRVESAEAHRIQYPQSLLKSSVVASWMQRLTTQPSSGAEDGDGEFGRRQQWRAHRWPEAPHGPTRAEMAARQRISDRGRGGDCSARSGCGDAAMALNFDVCNFDIDLWGAASGLV
jgi:hypothetical protein